MKCKVCKSPAVVALPQHNAGFCLECYPDFFSRQVQRSIRKHKMLSHEDRVLVCLSGGKDSLGLMHQLAHLEYDVTGLFVDLSIPRSSDTARATVEAFCERHGFALRVVELAREGMAIPEVKERVRKPVCSVCGSVKRYYFNKVALDEGYTALATGHNLDDEVARLFANTLRWDTAYLSDQGPLLPAERGFVKKIKPLYRLTEFETANYAFLMGIDYHHAPCPYSKGASFTFHKGLWSRLEQAMPGQKMAFYENFLRSGRQAFECLTKEQGPPTAPCDSCGYPTSAGVCSICRLRAQLDEHRAHNS